jgi:hypothetical protein
MKFAYVVAFALQGFVASGVFAIPFVDRVIIPDPFDHIIEGDGGFLQRSSGWGEISKYAVSSDDEHAWDAKLGSSVEMFRLRNFLSVDLGSEIELVASPDNDIQFKPRVFYWQESFFVMQRAGILDWGIGYYHRCRHDIDNIAEQEQFGEDLERVCIYDSVTFRAYPATIQWNWSGGSAGSARFTLDEHYYVLRQDTVPSQYSARELSIDGLIDTIAPGLEFEPLRRGPLGWYLDLKEYTDFYYEGALVTSADVMAETGIIFHGIGARFAFFLRYEHFAETLVDPWRQAGSYSSLGLKLY